MKGKFMHQRLKEGKHRQKKPSWRESRCKKKARMKGQ